MHRKTMAKAYVIPLMLALVLSLSTASWARPFGGGPMNLTPEQAGQLFDLKEQFMNETAGLRKAMWMKRAEMAALWKVENPDQAQIKAKQKELSALREQMQEKMVAYRLQARKICPMGGKGMGRGMGMGMGMGPGMGMGMTMAGDGPGMGPGCGF
ncbi:MAG: Spy/CpxP family protein refolding chaperone [Deltaproteobacteria bacterium]|nr:Spy/CpxP family protein refolding chaperone [Deltaproteobacteria bacterium]